jgi:hypothetical protein
MKNNYHSYYEHVPVVSRDNVDILLPALLMMNMTVKKICEVVT